MTKSAQIRFVNTDGGTLTIIRSTGKSGGFNVRASLKLKGDAKAQTGCRQVGLEADAAQQAFNTLVKTAEDRGWKRDAKQAKERDTFTEIPPAKTSAKRA